MTKTGSSKVVVRVENVSKTFRIPLEGSTGLKQKIINGIKGRTGYRTFTPLNDISFTIDRGDFFGIVGKNGSGKSTLLKTIAGIYTPTKGQVDIIGSLIPFIELGVGFNPELTGRENVYLNGALLGFDHKQIDEMYADIVEFAELEDFMEERLKNYSSGMQVRLAFSIAIKAEGDILLLDEVLAVGDAAFQQKCFDYFEQLKREKRTIIIVTHDMGAVKRFCNKAMLIKNGVIESYGKPQDIADIYTENNIEKVKTNDPKDEFEAELSISLGKKRYSQNDTITASIAYTEPKDIPTFINLSLVRGGAVVADLNTKYHKNIGTRKNDKVILTFSQKLAKFNPGTYDIYLSLHKSDDDRLLQQVPRAATFLIEGYDPSRDGAIRLEDGWR